MIPPGKKNCNQVLRENENQVKVNSGKLIKNIEPLFGGNVKFFRKNRENREKRRED